VAVFAAQLASVRCRTSQMRRHSGSTPAECCLRLRTQQPHSALHSRPFQRRRSCCHVLDFSTALITGALLLFALCSLLSYAQTWWRLSLSLSGVPVRKLLFSAHRRSCPLPCWKNRDWLTCGVMVLVPVLLDLVLFALPLVLRSTASSALGRPSSRGCPR
jgi:hypothetical protein